MKNKNNNQQPDKSLEDFLRDIFQHLVTARDEAQAGISLVQELRHQLVRQEGDRLKAALDTKEQQP